MHRLIRTLVASGAILAPLSAQATWTQLAPATAPLGRAGITGVSDGARMWVFGGNLGGTVLSDELWHFDGTTWTLVTPAGTPPSPRDWYASCWDPSRSRLVVFGGRDANNVALDDTWEFDGTTWFAMSPSNRPSPRRQTALAWDAVGQRCILFGGHDGSSATTGYDAETWAWDGTDWTLLAPSTVPPSRGRYQFSADLVRNRILMFGGRAASVLNDTWYWDGTDWVQVVTANAPGSTATSNTGLFAYAMTWDLVRDRHVLFGGTYNGPTLGTTWEFDGSDWLHRGGQTGLTGRTRPALAYLLAHGRSFLFGGYASSALSDTWDYQTAALPNVSQNGTGCPNALGVPSIGVSPPWQGDDLVTTIGTLPAGSLTEILIGFLPVNIPLAFLGFPACTVGADPTISVTVARDPNTGLATLQLSTPTSPSLAGATIYEQAVVLDFAGSPALSLSPRADVTFGVR